MYRSKIRVIPLSSEDELIMALGFERPGVPSRVSLTYRALIMGDWVEVARYDNAHGRPHRHRFWRHPEVAPLPAALTAAALLSRAEVDLRRPWSTYGRRMEAKGQ